MAKVETQFLILAALAKHALHGYGLVQEVSAMTDGQVRISVGTVYSVLDRLSDDGLIRLEREESANGRLRRYYALTDKGAMALEEQTRQLRRAADVATERLRAGRLTGRKLATS